MSEPVWYVEINDDAVGPMTAEEVRRRLAAGDITSQTLVYGPDTGTWVPLVEAAALLRGAEPEPAPSFEPAASAAPRTGAAPTGASRGGAHAADATPRATGSSARLSGSTAARPTVAHDIDYRIYGEELQFVEIELDPGESAVAEAGALFFMGEHIRMETILGDGSPATSGLLGKVVGAGKRLVSGENLFMTQFTNDGPVRETVAFAAPHVGHIVPVDLGALGGRLHCQKGAFLCAARGVSLGVAMQKKLGAGFLGGEGFVLQKLEGDGLAFVHACGGLRELHLDVGDIVKVDTGCVVAFQPSVGFDVQFVGGVKNALFGGEGLFLATLRGPGQVWLQSLPLSRLLGPLVSAGLFRSDSGSGVLKLVGNLLDT